MKTVLLTGITGFIAKRIADDLVTRGYHVRGSLRSMKRADEVRAIVDDPTKLSFVELDLMSDEGWDAAMDGVDAVIHTASPFPIASPKDPEELIRPAVDGTLRALRAAQKAGVNRIVLTASMVSIMHVERSKGHRFEPDDWTDIDHPTSSAYVQSKTLAEKAAWDFVKDHPEMQLTTIHPGLVCGTPMDAYYGSSLEVIERFWSGKDPMSPMMWLPVVDIKDVSTLHIAAMEQDAAISQRVVAADTTLSFPAMAQVIKDRFPDRKIATRVAPKFLLNILSLFDAELRTILPNVGREVIVNNEETQKLFGFNFVPAKDAIVASAEYVHKLKA